MRRPEPSRAYRQEDGIPLQRDGSSLRTSAEACSAERCLLITQLRRAQRRSAEVGQALGVTQPLLLAHNLLQRLNAEATCVQDDFSETLTTVTVIVMNFS